MELSRVITTPMVIFLMTLLDNAAATFSFEHLLPTLANIPEDGRLTFCPLARKYGYNCIRYNVVTDDGYILGVYNIPGDKTKPVYLQHGFIDSSDTFLIRNEISMVALLARNGYDIWLGNMRGNKYSRDHVVLHPDNIQFWEFSFHEIGIYDVPAIIDFILEKTGQRQLQAIGHSEGTTVFFVLGSMRPEYNDKIKLLICLAPIAYLRHALALSALLPLSSLIEKPIIRTFIPGLAHGELLGNSSQLVEILRAICEKEHLGDAVCYEGFYDSIFGKDPAQVDEEFLSVAIGHFPSGTSLKNGVHLSQITARNKFAQYDYGLLNLEKYGSTDPPEYKLSEFVMRTAFIVGLNDRLSDVRDVAELRPQVPRLVGYYEIPFQQWIHIDFVWGKFMPNYLYPYVLQYLHYFY